MIMDDCFGNENSSLSKYFNGGSLRCQLTSTKKYGNTVGRRDINLADPNKTVI